MTTALAQATQPRPSRGAPASAPPDDRNALGFYLFIAVNAILFVRPGDVIEALIGVEIYQYLILTCFLVSLPAVLDYLQPQKLEGRPIDLCVYLTLPLIMVSHLVAGRVDEMIEHGIVFFKIVIYYVLFVSLVTTPQRLRTLCGWLILYACVVVFLAGLDFNKVIRLPRNLTEFGTVALEETSRMYGPGLFQDPNDLCALVVAAALLALGRFLNGKGLERLIWLAALVVFAYGFYQTRSRGGMLAGVAGIAVASILRWGWQRALVIGALIGPLLIAAIVSQRSVNFDSQHDTGQTRVQLWNEGMVMFRANPIFGVGMDHYKDQANFVAHNSYMHAFAELGFPGGVLFLGATFLSIWGLMALREPAPGPRGQLIPRQLVDPVMDQDLPFIAGCIASWAVGMFSLSLNYRVVTYTFFAMGSMVLATAQTLPPRPVPRFELSLWVRLAGLGLAFIVGMFLLIRVLLRS